MVEKAIFEQNRPVLELIAASEQPGSKSDFVSVAESATNAAIFDGVQRALKDFTPMMNKLVSSRSDDSNEIYFRYLQQRIEEADSHSAKVKSRVAGLEAQLLEAQGARDIYRDQLDSANAALVAHAAAAARLADEHAELRKFALMSIEGARGEARDLKEVCRQLTSELRLRDAELDALRKRGYRDALSAAAGTAGDAR